jgi:hypothetical protein
MELLAPFTDIEDVVLVLLEPAGPTVLVTPATVTAPLIVVRRVGGFDDGITDVARLRVQTFGATHATASALAETCRQLILASPASRVVGLNIDRAVVESAPVYVDYGQPPLQRYVGMYRLEVRRPR